MSVVKSLERQVGRAAAAAAFHCVCVCVCVATVRVLLPRLKMYSLFGFTFSAHRVEMIQFSRSWTGGSCVVIFDRFRYTIDSLAFGPL